MNDQNQNLQAFSDMLDSEINALVDREISDQEVADILLSEVENLLEESTALMREEAARIEDTIKMEEMLRETEQNFEDIEKMEAIKANIKGTE